MCVGPSRISWLDIPRRANTWPEPQESGSTWHFLGMQVLDVAGVSDGTQEMNSEILLGPDFRKPWLPD